jgi:hypothetical protein
MILPGKIPPAGAAAVVPSRRVAVIIWSALVGGLLLFAAVATYVGPQFWRQANPVAPLLAAFAVGLACLELVLSLVLPKRLTARVVQAAPGTRALQQTIIASALNEGAGLFGVVTWLLGGLPLSLVAITIALVGLLLAFPSARRWEAMGGAPPASAARPNRLVR